MWSPLTRSCTLKGPVPTGCRAKFAPSCRTALGEHIIPERSVRMEMRGANGWLSLIWTVYGPPAVTD